MIAKTSERAEILSRSVLQHDLESNFGDDLSMEPSESYFYLHIGIFFLKLGKKEDILDWEWGQISTVGDKEERPCKLFFMHMIYPYQK